MSKRIWVRHDHQNAWDEYSFPLDSDEDKDHAKKSIRRLIDSLLAGIGGDKVTLEIKTNSRLSEKENEVRG